MHRRSGPREWGEQHSPLLHHDLGWWQIGTSCKPGLTARLTALLKCTQSMDLLWREAAVGTSSGMQGQRKGVPFLFTQPRSFQFSCSNFLVREQPQKFSPSWMFHGCYCTLTNVEKEARFLEPNGDNLENWTLQMSEWLLIKRDRLPNPYALSCLCISHCMVIRKSEAGWWGPEPDFLHTQAEDAQNMSAKSSFSPVLTCHKSCIPFHILKQLHIKAKLCIQPDWNVHEFLPGDFQSQHRSLTGKCM